MTRWQFFEFYNTGKKYIGRGTEIRRTCLILAETECRRGADDGIYDYFDFHWEY